MAISGFGSTTIGFAACGIIVSHYPIQWAFYLDALSFIVSAICIGFIPVEPLRVGSRTNLVAIISNLKTGGQFMIGNSPLRSLFLVTIPVILAFGLWNSLLLPFTLSTLHATTFEYGLQEGLTCLAFVAGSLLVMRLGDRIDETKWIVISFLGMGVVGIDYALTSNVPFAICFPGNDDRSVECTLRHCPPADHPTEYASRRTRAGQ